MVSADRILCIHGCSLDVLKTFPVDSVDSCVTDPPYELGFMGKKWDNSGIANNVELWREVLRVLKPGAHLLSFGGTRTYHRMTCAVEDAGFEIRDCIYWTYGSGFPKSHNLDDGLGTALKPAHEPIVVARKPLAAGTVAANVQKHGTGALNIDACRVAASTSDNLARDNRPGENGWMNSSGGPNTAALREAEGLPALGRWPANVLLSHSADCAPPDCAPDCPVAMMDRQSGKSKSTDRPRNNTAAAHNKTASMGKSSGDWTTSGHADSGGASRFFHRFDADPFIYQAKASKKDRGEGNTHPTVKPISLMRYLVRLVTPPGGTVLDPFAGSGTTLVAARAEGFDSIGIELDPSHIDIVGKRISTK